MPGATFDKSKRLLNAGAYQRVFNGADFKVGHGSYLILARTNELGWPRLGLVIAKKHLRLAVDRNRIKRVVRETFRHHCDVLDSLDIVFLARRELAALPPEQHTELLNRAWQRLSKKLNGAGGPGS